ncbi:MAG: hypothetical protein ACRC5C_03545, partial [Bacilli bacterium]
KTDGEFLQTISPPTGQSFCQSSLSSDCDFSRQYVVITCVSDEGDVGFTRYRWMGKWEVDE